MWWERVLKSSSLSEKSYNSGNTSLSMETKQQLDECAVNFKSNLIAESDLELWENIFQRIFFPCSNLKKSLLHLPGQL